MANPAAHASPRRRKNIIAALRRGTVPEEGLDVLAVGLERFESAIEEELERVATGAAGFKAVRGEYGSGKTFISRWLIEGAKHKGFAAAEVQISESETPLHRLETIYRRVTEKLTTDFASASALRDIIDGWFHILEQDAINAGADQNDEQALQQATAALFEQRLAEVAKSAPAFAAALRGYRRAQFSQEPQTADGLLGWLGGQKHVAASVKRYANIRGELDHTGAFAFLQGLLVILRDSEFSGLVIVLDEVETLQRVRSDIREKSLNALRQLIDEIDAGRFPGLYLVITGTPAFFDGRQGIQRLQPLADRLSTEFLDDDRFDNPRAVQIRLPGFDLSSLVELGVKVRDLYAADADPRVVELVDNAYIADLAQSLAGRLGGRASVAPRLFLKKLIDVLDRVDQHPEFVPREHYQLRVSESELHDEERVAARKGDLSATAVLDAIDLDS